MRAANVEKVPKQDQERRKMLTERVLLQLEYAD